MVTRIGSTVVRVTTYTGAAMRKHGSDRHCPLDGQRRVLDAVAALPVVYDSPTVRVRKAGSR